MSDLHHLCRFPERPIGSEYLTSLKTYLSDGIPATYTVEEAVNYENGIEEEPSSTTTPLHLICSNLPVDASEDEMGIIGQMVEMLFEYGAGWCLADVNGDTPGCILVKRNLSHLPVYKQMVDAGVRAELLLRKVSEFDMEVIEDDELEGMEIKRMEEKEEPKEQEEVKETEEKEEAKAEETNFDPAEHQSAYLSSKLEYTEDALITQNKDGVMMSWEHDIMRLGKEALFEGAVNDGEIDAEINVLNIGFGMGIIDTMIQEQKPTKHYICEAHPDVLAKMRRDGWFDKKNVVVLEGRWQECLDKLLSSGEVFFNGIYYDTFSEHYSDMLELFDYIVGLLKPHGVFSFFNGLGADRQVVYDVYRSLVEIDLANYGLKCEFTNVDVPVETLKKGDKSVWDEVKRSYWECPVYYHPKAKFFD